MALFFGPKIKHPDEQVRLKALARQKDPATLVDVACHDSSPTVRMEAVRRISEPGRLAEVVRSGKGDEARVNAVQRIHDQELLAQIILERKNFEIMKAAFQGITDPKALAKIAEDSRYNIAARRIAIEHFADVSLLEDVARNVTTPGVREAALERLSQEGKEEAAEALKDTGDDGQPDTANIRHMLERYGADRIVDAIGKFRGSEKAVRSLGFVARTDEAGREKALRYLEKTLEHSNPHLRSCALEELAATLQPEAWDSVAARMGRDPEASVRETVERLQRGAST